MEKVKNLNNADEINDYLIEIVKDPPENLMEILYYLYTHLDNRIFRKIKINWIYALGELGKKKVLNIDIIKRLLDIYFESDRWERHEIIQVFEKISEHQNLSREVIDLLSFTLSENYLPIKLNALKTIKNIVEIPDPLLIKLFYLLNSSELEIKELVSDIISKFVNNEIILFEKLNYEEVYKNLSKKAIISLIYSCISTSNQIVSFRDMILKSNWSTEFKNNFLRAIELYENIVFNKN
ncbi:MAG: hypothetical protein ACTSQJ_13145 [Promethearchaeota archaeon]